jgi:hypothetical protein
LSILLFIGFSIVLQVLSQRDMLDQVIKILFSRRSYFHGRTDIS